MKRILYFIVMGILWVGCGEPEPRKPKKQTSGSFIRESVERSRALLAQEEELIQKIIKQDSIHNYRSSASGSWYYYETQNTEDSYTIQSNDLVTLTYNLQSLANDTIYTTSEIGTLIYKVDKQELFPGTSQQY